MWRSIASNGLTLLIVALLGLVGLLAWGRQVYVQPGPLTQPICFKVEKGASISAVSRALAEQGAITDARIFRIGADYSDRSGQLKYGSYLIPANASMSDIVGIVTSDGVSTCGREVTFRVGIPHSEVLLRSLDPVKNRYIDEAQFDPAVKAAPQVFVDAMQDPSVRYRVTIAEGVTSWEVVNELKRADFLSGKVDKLPAEGSLAPDSYAVDKGENRNKLLAEMAKRQKTILAEAWAKRAANLPYKDPEQALIMASLVEKETGKAGERSMVASVFLNRLAKGMKLQTDPSVIYGITKGHGVLGRGIRESELRKRTPWNTYVIDGLPATPIANPGKAAIEAALHPAHTDYLYFVANGTGGHAFAATLAEHNKNVAKWRAYLAQQEKNASASASGADGTSASGN